MSTNGVPAPHPAQRSQRVLACVLCQHRKIKCDRNTPCSNCLKANVTCTPSTPAPARKRRRPNQDLQERLARCEALLKQYAGAGAPPPQPPPRPAPAASAPTPAQGPSPSPAQTPGTARTPGPSPTEPNGLWPTSTPNTYGLSPLCVPDPLGKVPAGKMIEEEGGARFVDNSLWTSFYDELQAMKQIIDTDDPDESVGPDAPTPDHAADTTDLLFPGYCTPGSIDQFHPEPVHALRLWQIFLDRVNPLTKIIHVPSLQPHLVEAATDPNAVPIKYQALLFSIYLMASIALSEDECAQVLGVSKHEAIRKFTSATRHALIQFDFLRNYDMASLQALVFFLYSLQGRYDRHAAWVLSGTILRIAQKMGYHRDGEVLNLTPFETEMRRRIWWQLIFQDTKLAVVSGLSHNFSRSFFDTKQPQNLNDADLFPGSTEPVVAREGPTEMAFMLMMNRVALFMLSENTRMDFEAAIVAHGSTDSRTSVPEKVLLVDKCRALMQNLDDDLREIERKYIDPSAGGVHTAAKTIRTMLTEKVLEMMKPTHEQPEYGTEIHGPKDNFFKIVLMNNEHNVDSYETMHELGFLWLVLIHFQLEAFSVLTGQLCHRTTGSLADRGWKVIEKIYKWQPELYDMSVKVYSHQAQFTLRAWKAREQALAKLGVVPETPQAIIKLRELLPSYESRSSTAASLTPPSAMQMQVPSMDNMDPYLPTLDTNSFGWDMWDMMPGANPANSQLSAAFFGGFNIPGLD